MLRTYKFDSLGINTYIKTFSQGVARQTKWLTDRYHKSHEAVLSSSHRFSVNDAFGLFKNKVLLCDLTSMLGAGIVARIAANHWLTPVLAKVLSPWSLLFAKVIIGLLLGVVVGVFAVLWLSPLLAEAHIFFYKQVRSFYGIKDSDIMRHGTSNLPEKFVRLSKISVPSQLGIIKESLRISVALLRNHLELLPGSKIKKYALESAIAEFWFGCKTNQSGFKFVGLNKLDSLSHVAFNMADLEYLMVADAAVIGAVLADESLLQHMRWLIEHVLQPEGGSLFVSSEPVAMKIDRARKLANERLLPTHSNKFKVRYAHIKDEEIFNRVQFLHEIVSLIKDLIRHETLGPALFALDASLPDERLLGPLSRI